MSITNISCDPPSPPPTPAHWAQIKPHVLAYLQQSPAIMVARTKHPDVLDPGKTFAVPVSVRTLDFQVPTITVQMQQEAIHSLRQP